MLWLFLNDFWQCPWLILINPVEFTWYIKQQARNREVVCVKQAEQLSPNSNKPFDVHSGYTNLSANATTFTSYGREALITRTATEYFTTAVFPETTRL